MNLNRFAPLCALLSIVAPTPPLHAQLQVQGKATITGQADAAEAVSFDVYLPHQHKEALEALLTEQQTAGSANYHKWLTPAQFGAQFALSPAKVKAMESELEGYGLQAEQVSPHRLHVTGTASQVQAALSTTLKHAVRGNGKRALVAASELNLPHTITDAGGVVLAFDATQRMQLHTHTVALPANRYSQAGPYWFDDLKQAYSWPSYKVVNGKGSTIGILISGGYQQSDMDLYFGHEKLASPKVSVVNVSGGTAFDPSDDGSFEAELDIQQSGGMAPGADIVLYSIPDLSDNQIFAGLVAIVEENRVDVVNMSFGGPELFYSAEYSGGTDYTGILHVYDDLFAEGNALGITFVASSGDAGATWVPPLSCLVKNPSPNCGALVADVSFPASSPHITAVGGTNLGTVAHPKNPANLGSAYLYEEAFGDPVPTDFEFGTPATGAYWGSGGGDSRVFKKPAYQKLVTTGSKVRAVPDIALHMGGCPGIAGVICNADDSADLEVFGGGLYGVIGTSASSPDFAGLTALNVEVQGTRLGNENYYIYALAAAQKQGLVSDVYHTKIPGYNGLYSSGNNGYNRVLGVGTPYGKNFLLMPDAEAAGKPQTPSNP